jgi:predicted thioesterase
MPTPGLAHQLSRQVTEEMTATRLGSGGVDVLGTPFMISMMELASWQAVQDHLEPGLTSVGTVVNIRHLAATPVGDIVTARSELVEVDGRRLVFRVEAWDTAARIGEGTHERYIVHLERFLERVAARRRG